MDFLSFFSNALEFTGIFFSVVLTISLIIIFFLSLKGNDLAPLILGEGTGKVSQSKFWANVAYFVVTITFIKINYSEAFHENITEIWLIYLSVVASNSLVSKWLALRYKKGNGDQTQTPEKHDSNE